MNSNGMAGEVRGNTKKERELPRRMYKHALSYRLHLADGTRINLGRDLNSALMKYQLLIGGELAGEFCTADEVARMLKRHAKGAKNRGLSFSIDAEHVQSMLVKQGYRCAVTGLKFRDDKPPGSRIRPWLPSIDGVNTRLGYEPGNVRVVCGFVNVALNAFGDHGFRQVMEPLIEAEVQRRVAVLSESECCCRQEAIRMPSIISELRELRAIIGQ